MFAFLAEKVVKSDILLDYSAVGVFLDAVCSNHCEVQSVFRTCNAAECFYFVAIVFFIVGIDFVFVGAEFHFTKVDYFVASRNYKVYLAASPTVLFVKPSGTFCQYVAYANCTAELFDVVFAE